METIDSIEQKIQEIEKELSSQHKDLVRLREQQAYFTKIINLFLPVGSAIFIEISVIMVDILLK